MAAIVNGLSISKLRAFGVTFFIFSDYARASMGLSAIMELPAIFVFTHDGMGDGEDGPTHQPVEYLALTRATSGLVTLTSAGASVGDPGRISGMKTFGASTPLKELHKKFGFEPEWVVAAKEPMGRA